MPRIRKTQQETRATQHKVWKIAVYIRLSKDDGNDESLSVTNQKKIIMEYLELNFEGEYIIVDFYIDDGVSGTTDYERPNFQRMIHDVETGEVNCIICKTLARAFRNYSDQGYFLENFFPSHGVRFISTGDPVIDTFTHPEVMQGMEVPITGLMNDRYAARTSNDVRRTFNMKRRKGEFIGAFAPYGYAKDPDNKNHLIIDDEAAQVVRNIFEWFVHERMSKLGIAKRLTEMGVPVPTEYKHSKGLPFKSPTASRNDGLWAINTIFRILKNQMYIGNMVQGQQRVISYKVHDKIATPEEEWFVVENTHEPIVSKDLFNKAQDLQNRDTRTAPTERNLQMFSGFLRCADCKGGMMRKKSKNMVYYYCRTYVFKSKERCTKHSIKEEVLIDTVLQAIRKQAALVSSMANMVEEINQAPTVHTQSKNLQRLLSTNTHELERLVCATDSLYMDWKNGDISKGEYHRMKAKFEEQSEQLRQVVKNLQEEITIAEQGISIYNPYLTTFIKYQNIESLDRSTVVDLIDIIYVHENGEVSIKFNFADQHSLIQEFIENNNKKLILVEKKAV